MDTAVRVKLHDELLAEMPEGARHDSDICPFCVEKASQSTASDPSGSGRPDVPTSEPSTEGGTRTPMSDNASTMTQEMHEALSKKAVEDATKTTEAALATKTEEAAAATKRATELETASSDLKAENDRLNKELDDATVKLTAATEEVAGLKKDIAESTEAATLKETASKRSEQVKNLKLFKDEFVTDERASRWAGLTDEAWGEQLEEWKQLAPATAAAGDDKSDAASAMTGTSDLTKDDKTTDTAGAGDEQKSSRRAVLNLA